MSTMIVLDVLPVLNQGDYPALPVSVTHVCGTKLGSAEKEAVAGIVLLSCIKAGEWKPVSATEFGRLAAEYVPSKVIGIRWVVNAYWDLIRMGTLKWIKVDDVQYIVPTTEFAYAALSGAV